MSNKSGVDGLLKTVGVVDEELVQNRLNQKPKWLLVDIGDVLLLKNKEVSFSTLLANELEVDEGLAQEINRLHFTTMETSFVPEKQFIINLEKNLGYKAPSNIYARFARAYEKQIRPNVEFLQFLDSVREQGVKTAILSNTIAIYSRVQEQAGVNERAGFYPIIYSWEVGMAKPNEGIFRLALERLAAKPNEIIFIDDKQKHLDGAALVGMRTLLFNNTNGVISALRKAGIN